jgi:hypothetical protein
MCIEASFAGAGLAFWPQREETLNGKRWPSVAVHQSCHDLLNALHRDTPLLLDR